MTYPTEAQLIEMEQRARWLLDRTVVKTARAEEMEDAFKSNSRAVTRAKINAAWDKIERNEAIARDVLALVALVRAGGCRRAAAA